MANPKVYVLVVNYNGKHHLEYCLPSLIETDYDNYRIVLVDNASVDTSVAYTRQNFPQIHILQNKENQGWAGGNNTGIRFALNEGADYIVLQNNDTLVDSRWISHAVTTAEADSRIGFIGFRMLQEYVQGEDADRATFKALMSAWDTLEVVPATHITGAAMFVRADVFKNIGLIDEVYYFYGEEDDLRHRAEQAGYKSMRINIPLWHYNGGSSRGQKIKFSYFAMRNNIRFLLKNGKFKEEIIPQSLWLIKFACLPRPRFDPGIPHFSRLRPSNFVVNAMVLAVALLWNLIFLPATLRSRREAEQRIAATQQRWVKEAIQ